MLLGEFIYSDEFILLNEFIYSDEFMLLGQEQEREGDLERD